MDKGNLSPTQPQSLIQHHVYVLRDAVSYPTPSAPPLVSPMLRLPSQPPHSASCLCIARRSLVPHTISIAPVLSLPSPRHQHRLPVSPMLRLPSQPAPPPRSLTFFPFFPPFPSVPIHLITLSAISEQAHIALAHSRFCARPVASTSRFSRASATPVRLQALRGSHAVVRLGTEGRRGIRRGTGCGGR